MAFHEQHERSCPTCGERISATAPKCFNCGEYVDDDDDTEEEEEGGRPWPGRLVLVLGAALCCVGLAIYLLWGRKSGPENRAEERVEQLHQVLGQKAGISDLNSSSPVVLAEVEPRLRVGMPFEEVTQLVSRKNAGPGTSTVIGTAPGLGSPEGADPNPPRQGYIIYLKDASLVVQTDGEGKLVSWKSKPLR